MNKEDFTMIACVDMQNGIGYDGKLLYHIQEDMAIFHRLTDANIVIMGKRTLYSLPKRQPLKNRVNIVVSKDPTFAMKSCVVCRSVEEAIDEANAFTGGLGLRKFVIGGGCIYQQFMPYCNTLYITRIHNDRNIKQRADTFFPDIDANIWVKRASYPVPISRKSMHNIFGTDYKKLIRDKYFYDDEYIPIIDGFVTFDIYERRNSGN